MKTDLLSHIAVNIFSQLSDKVLGECRRTNKAWKEFIDKQKFYYIRQLANTKSKQPKFFSINKQWNTIVDKFDESQSLPDLKNMNVFLKHFFKTKQPEKHDPLEWTMGIYENHPEMCKILSTLIHFFFLACFTFMFLEAIHLYALVGWVVKRYLNFFLTKYSFVLFF